MNTVKKCQPGDILKLLFVIWEHLIECEDIYILHVYGYVPIKLS